MPSPEYLEAQHSLLINLALDLGATDEEVGTHPNAPASPNNVVVYVVADRP